MLQLRNGKNGAFLESGGHLLFTRHDYPLHLSDIAFVKVGAVSGADEVYTSDYSRQPRLCLFNHRRRWQDPAHDLVRAGRYRRPRRCCRTRSA
jgi:hypothetical protein